MQFVLSGAYVCWGSLENKGGYKVACDMQSALYKGETHRDMQTGMHLGRSPWEYEHFNCILKKMLANLQILDKHDWNKELLGMLNI